MVLSDAQVVAARLDTILKAHDSAKNDAFYARAHGEQLGEQLRCARKEFDEVDMKRGRLEMELQLEKRSKEKTKKKATNRKKEIDQLKETMFQERLGNQENRANKLNRDLRACSEENAILKATAQKLRLRLQEVKINNQAKEMESFKLMREKKGLQQKLEETESKLQNQVKHKLSLRQQNGILKERIKHLEENDSVKNLQEQHQKELQAMELKFLKKEKRWKFDLNKSLLEREKSLNDKYSRIAETAINNAQISSQAHLKRSKATNRQLEKELVQLRFSTIPLEVHRELLDEAQKGNHLLGEIRETRRRQVENAETRSRHLATKLEMLETSFTAMHEQAKVDATEKSNTVNLVTARLHDREELVSSLKGQCERYQVETLSLKRMLSRCEKTIVELRAKLHISKDTEERNGEMIKDSKIEKEHILNKHKIRIAQLETELGVRDNLLQQVKLETEERVAALQAELVQTNQRMNMLLNEHDKMTGTVQTLIPEVQKSRIRTDHAEKRAVDILKETETHLAQVKAEEVRLAASLQNERVAHACCRDQLLREKQAVQELSRVKATLASALEIARQNHIAEVGDLQEKLRQLRIVHEETAAKYKHKVERIELNVAQLVKQKHGVDSSTTINNTSSLSASTSMMSVEEEKSQT
mmetsp:Transcript_30840/g.49457  ORF Transcript_30840/g.49457 Transcript_30840/m.49457 type:complete len:646 (-) Transcript_30840:137-2074(-)|eukprot:CAMPEP_0203752214 /NCGR_PEP_ID=MMETSP0098-20131031/6160_1 /ASSEMBLY_ACC=CAM_ASM_000208 /TAXON_ID=96639 /ORGANISM=" , Strain NY0313808BC1" /LENGTH=645 /DNA_ID=CAMNT_0050642271 /DNA_START=2481 /DNA_END=4418 /DNA_ORIENTATION=-